MALTFFGNEGWVGVEIQLALATLLIFLVGIPHGAIDHIIFFEENKTTSPAQFYTFYLTTMGLYVLAWLYLPAWSFIFFLILSAFHFGQSQFSDIDSVSKKTTWWLNLTWGTSILSGLIFYRASELHQVFSGTQDLDTLLWVFNENFHRYISIGSTVICVLILAIWAIQKRIAYQRLFLEFFLLGLIHLSFLTLPVIIGFTLYFTTLHSTRVLVEEYNYLKRKRAQLNVKQFITMLLPYTLMSVIGGGFLLYASNWNWISISNILLGLILISIITLPHSIVMDRFYGKMK